MGASSWGQMYQIIRALGTPSEEEVKALNPSCSGRMADHLNKLAHLRRPAKPWTELLPAFAHLPEALELPARLLAYAPSSRLRPSEALGWSLFCSLPEDPALPEAIFDFTAEELRACDAEARRNLQDLEVRRSKRSSNAQTPSTQASEGGDGAHSESGVLEASSETELPPERPEAEESCGYGPDRVSRSVSRASRRRAEPYAPGAAVAQQCRAHAAG